MSVTGANYLLDFGSRRVLVDCGLVQGSKYAEELNYAPFAYEASKIDYVFITHSHTDHIGRLPKLFKEGFRGKVYTTRATRDLMRQAFPDNWRHLAEEAKADHHDPLFSPEDIEAVMALTEGQPYHQSWRLSDNLLATFFNAGHILGSAIVCFTYEEEGQTRKIYFSGDLGNSPSLLLPNKDFVNDADYLVVESAYGNRVHEDKEKRSLIFEQVLKYVIDHRGTLLIPSFAIERTQEILFEINKLFQAKAVPSIPVFMDSPLAAKMTAVYSAHEHDFNKEALSFNSAGESIFDFPDLHYTSSVEDSKQINEVNPPKVIIAGSGMSNGGRILHHERRYLSDPNSAIVFVGYQVEGSLGRRILDKEPEVSIFGDRIQVHCLVKGIGGYSAHADQPALLEWIGVANTEKKLKKVFVVQGEEGSSKALAALVTEKLGLEAVVPKPDQSFDL